VVNVDEDRVVAVDVDNGKVARAFAVGAEPHGIDISAEGRWLFVSSKTGQQLSRIDLHDGSVKAMGLQPAPCYVAYAAAVGKLYVSSRVKPLIWALNPDDLKIVDRIDIGRGVAHQMVILP
jgi:DNA-binding beta-propeller fold protein YncE